MRGTQISLNQTQKARLRRALDSLNSLSSKPNSDASVTVSDVIPVNFEDGVLKYYNTHTNTLFRLNLELSFFCCCFFCFGSVLMVWVQGTRDFGAQRWSRRNALWRRGASQQARLCPVFESSVQAWGRRYHSWPCRWGKNPLGSERLCSFLNLLRNVLGWFFFFFLLYYYHCFSYKKKKSILWFVQIMGNIWFCWTILYGQSWYHIKVRLLLLWIFDRPNVCHAFLLVSFFKKCLSWFVITFWSGRP